MPQNNLTTISEGQKTDKIQQETVNENAVAQSEEKDSSKKEKLQWIKNWDIKKYNSYFVQIYILYHFIFLMILWGQCTYDFDDIWHECGWYIPVQFIIPYVVYLGIKYLVAYKKGELENKETK